MLGVWREVRHLIKSPWCDTPPRGECSRSVRLSWLAVCRFVPQGSVRPPLHAASKTTLPNPLTQPVPSVRPGVQKMRYLLGPWGNDEQGRPIASDTVDWHQDYAPKNGTWEWKSMALGSPVITFTIGESMDFQQTAAGGPESARETNIAHTFTLGHGDIFVMTSEDDKSYYHRVGPSKDRDPTVRGERTVFVLRWLEIAFPHRAAGDSDHIVHPHHKNLGGGAAQRVQYGRQF